MLIDKQARIFLQQEDTPTEHIPKINNTSSSSLSSSLTSMNLISGSLSHKNSKNISLNSDSTISHQDEVLANERDYKRRRSSYRGKTVNIKKQTPKAILRDLISALEEDLVQNKTCNNKNLN